MFQSSNGKSIHGSNGAVDEPRVNKVSNEHIGSVLLFRSRKNLAICAMKLYVSSIYNPQNLGKPKNGVRSTTKITTLEIYAWVAITKINN